jgi:hypothetical protein
MIFNRKYKLYLKCDNCGFLGNVKLKKGIPYHLQECPNCKCACLDRPIIIKREDSVEKERERIY